MSVSESRKRRYLDFELPLQELDQQIAQLKSLKLQQSVDVTDEIKALEQKSDTLLRQIFSNLTPYQVVQMARHPDRPTSLDYIEAIFEDFVPLHGDRAFLEDRAIVGGLASLEGRSVVILGHQKGKSTQDNMLRNFGMPKPEGYRKALRLMELAERFRLPLLTFIDTPGAYPGIEAEERGQAVAIAQNVMRMTDLGVPILSTIIGEGGSGGALAIAVSDRLLMLENTIYSVISPEGCAAITWKNAAHASQAAEALRVTAKELFQRKLADLVVSEPLGGAHRDPLDAAHRLKMALSTELKKLSSLETKSLLSSRYDRYRAMGQFV